MLPPQERYLQREQTACEVPLLTFNEAQDIAEARWVLAPQSSDEYASNRFLHASVSYQWNSVLSAGA